MVPTTYMITGCKSGIGLAMARQLLAASPANQVLAAVRRPAEGGALHALKEEYAGRLEMLEMDVADVASIQRAASAAAALPFLAHGLDVLANNAGVFAGTFSGPLEPDALSTLHLNLATNLVGPVAATQAFLPLLRRGRLKSLWFTSAIAASQGGWPGQTPICATYAVSKAGMNVWALKLARALGPEGFRVVAFHPGLVRTAMTAGAEAAGAASHAMTPEESAEKVLKMLGEREVGEEFAFRNFDGTVIPF